MRGRVLSLLCGVLVPGATLLCATVLYVTLPGTAAAQHSRKACPPPTPLELTLPDREQIALALSRPTDTIVVELLANPCRAPVIRDTALQLGAQLGYSEAQVGFFRLRVRPSVLLALLQTPGVEAITIPHLWPDDRLVPVDERTPRPTPQIQLQVSRVRTAWFGTRWAKDTTPRPYFAARESGLERLWAERPDADGRGTRVAVVDDLADWLHPIMGEAFDSAGRPVPKVAEVHTTSDPREGNDAGWVIFRDSAQAVNQTITLGPHTWRVPADDRYHFGLFAMRLALGAADSSPALPLRVGVLWDRGTNTVWVDTDGDFDFTDERALTDYRVRHELGWFGAEAAWQDHRIPFAVQIEPARDAIHLHVPGNHGTLVAAALAGNQRYGGLFDGAAPGAQLIDERQHSSLLLGLVASAARPEVDVINRSGWIGQRRTPYETQLEQRLVERLFDVYRKPLVAYSPLRGTIHVNDYQSAEMLQRNRQLPSPWVEAMNSFTWLRDDGLVNAVLAPSASLGAQSRVVPHVVSDSTGRHLSYDTRWDATRLAPPAPDGYYITSNNSPTIPVVSGILASVIGLAKRDSIPYDGRRLMHALFASARLVNGFPTHVQGYGLVQADSLWHLLRRMAKADAGGALTYFTVERGRDRTRTSGPRIEVAGFLEDRTDEVGPKAEPLERTVWLTRRGGPKAARTYRLGWRGNDGTFTLARETLTLRRDQTARVTFRVRQTPGWHLAFLRLVDIAAGAVMQEVPITVRMPLPYQRIAPFVREYTDTIPPRHRRDSYFGVTDSVQALRVTVSMPDLGPWQISKAAVTAPDHAWTRGTVVAVDSSRRDTTLDIGPMETRRMLFHEPDRGVWTVFTENRSRPEYESAYDRPAPGVPIVSRYRVEALRLKLTPLGDTAMQAVNERAAVTGRLEGFVASVGTDTLRTAAGEALAATTRTVPESTVALRISVTAIPSRGEPDDTAAIADLHALDCSSGEAQCQVVASTPVRQRGAGRLTVRAPKAGAWRYVVLRRIERGDLREPMRFVLTDAIVHASAYGTADVSDTSITRPTEAAWHAPVRVTPAGYLDAGRTRGTYVAFRSDSDELLALTPLTPELP